MLETKIEVKMMPPLLIDHEQAEFAVKLLDGIVTEIAGSA